MTDAEIIAAAKELTQQQTGTPDSVFLGFLNRIVRTYAGKMDWPQYRVINAVLTTVANTGAYDLPADFHHLIGNQLVYNPNIVTGGYQYGTPLQFIASGTQRLDTVLQALYTTGAGFPREAFITSKPGEPGTLQLILFPFPDTSAQPILFSYYRKPTELDGSGIEVDVDILSDTYTYALAKQIEMTLNQPQRVQFFSAEERLAYRAATSSQLLA